jgi:hypothetical protein
MVNEMINDRKKIIDKKYIIIIALVIILAIALQILFKFGLFAPDSNLKTGYFIGLSGFFIFFLIYAIIKKLE